MGKKIEQDGLFDLTQNLINDYLNNGSIEGIAAVLDDEAVAYSPMVSKYARGSWEVRQFLRQEYDRMMPCQISRCKLRYTDNTEGATVLANVVLNCTQYKRLIFWRLAFMYRYEYDAECPTLTGIHMYRDFRHENTYRSVSNNNINSEVVEYLASYDELTGVYNKQAFYNKTKDMLMENLDKSFDMLRINIERFKVINDLFGEVVGDRLLRYIGRFLKDINLPLCVSGRLYADNFVVCFEAGNGNSKRLIKTLQMMADSFSVNHRTILSFGLYRIEEKDLPVSVMCDRANLALTQAKGNFQTPYCEYDDNMRQQMVMEQKIVNAMESAIENKEFMLFLQPKYELEGERMIGAEALVRWNSSKDGFISPGDFIPVFEKNGFVYAVDKFIWEETCRYLQKWIQEGREVKPISVNVSRVDLYDPKLVQYLVNLRERYGIPENLLELEITESAYTEDPEQIISMTTKLREAGFLILMDDFGSGYSSLNMLKEIHIDVLKLDMGFLKSSDHSSRGGNILAAIMQMANSLKMQTIAEGVETKEQLEFLRSIGCQWVQGFYYSKPIAADEYEKLL